MIRPEQLQVFDFSVSQYLTTVRLCAIMSSQGWVTMRTYWHSMDLNDSTSSIFCQAFGFIFVQNSSSIFVLRHENKWLTNPLPCIIIIRHLRECWNGRQARLRCVWLCRVGSSPISRTKNELPLWGGSFFARRWDSKGRHQSADWCKKCPVDTF